MKNFVNNNISSWYLVVAALIILEICNQKILATMVEPSYSVVLSCIIMGVLFMYLGCLCDCMVSTYFSRKQEADETILKRIETLENTLVVLDEKNKELENQLTKQAIENANNIYSMTMENMSNAFSMNKSFLRDQFIELDGNNRSGIENFKNTVTEQNTILQALCTNIDKDLKEQCGTVNSNIFEKTDRIINKLIEESVVSKTNQEVLVEGLATIETKQAEALTSATEQLNIVAAENYRVVLETMEAAGTLAKANKEAIVSEIANVRAKQAEALANATEQLNIVAAENHRVVLEIMDASSSLTKANQEALVNGLITIETKQVEIVEKAVKQIAETSAADQEKVTNLIIAQEEQVQKQIGEVCESVTSSLAEQLNAVKEAMTRNHKVLLDNMEVACSVEKTNQDVLLGELENAAKQQTDIIRQIGDARTVNINSILAIEKIVKENKATLAAGFNNLSQKQKATFDDMYKKFNSLESLVNSDRAELYKQFDVLKKEQETLFQNMLEQIAQMQTTTQDTIADEISKLRIIEDILEEEFEEEEEEPKYDVTKPPIEVEDKFTVNKKNPDRVETIVDEKLGTEVKNEYKNNKLVSSKVIAGEKVTYELIYDVNERPQVSRTFDNNGNINIEIEYYGNGQVKKRTQTIIQNGKKIKQVTNFDANGNKIK